MFSFPEAAHPAVHGLFSLLIYLSSKTKTKPDADSSYSLTAVVMFGGVHSWSV